MSRDDFSFDVGDLVRIRARFLVSSRYTDPGDVTLILKPPSGASISFTDADPEMIREDDGMYYLDHLLDQSGLWRFRWEGTSPAQGAQEGLFLVREQKVS